MLAFVDVLLCLMILIKKKKIKLKKRKKENIKIITVPEKKGFANCVTNCFPHGESSTETVYSLKFVYYRNEVNNDFWRGTFYTTVNSLMTEVHII